jgi:hypothetical protein
VIRLSNIIDENPNIKNKIKVISELIVDESDKGEKEEESRKLEYYIEELWTCIRDNVNVEEKTKKKKKMKKGIMGK